MDPTWIVRLDVPGDGPRLAVKDCIDVEGLPTTAGCQVVAEQASPAVADAPVVAAARRAGARIVGKTNLTELCWSASGGNSWSGTPVARAGRRAARQWPWRRGRRTWPSAPTQGARCGSPRPAAGSLA